MLNMKSTSNVYLQAFGLQYSPNDSLYHRIIALTNNSVCPTSSICKAIKDFILRSNYSVFFFVCEYSGVVNIYYSIFFENSIVYRGPTILLSNLTLKTAKFI